MVNQNHNKEEYKHQVKALSEGMNKQILDDLHTKYDIQLAELERLDTLASSTSKSIISLLLNSDILPKDKLEHILTTKYGLKLVNIEDIDIDNLPYNLTNPELLDKYNAVPLYQHQGNLFIAINDPNDFTTLSTYQFKMSINIQAVLMSQSNIDKVKKIIKTKFTNQSLNTIDLDVQPTNKNNHDKQTNDSDSNPIVGYVNKIISAAVKQDASDIHFEPYKINLRVRFRIDGNLKEIAQLPIETTSKISSRLKILAALDISEKRIPQDGRFNLEIDNNNYDFRVSSCPTLFGEKLVIRILDPYKAKLGIDELGYEKSQKELFVKALNKLQGIILVTGPTGSGKTISLYTALNILNTDDRNISTAEDPIEIYLPGVNQVQVNNKINLSFASALRCFLRQDPDVMMVGEIRDLETAEIAIKAAQTGHLVLSTLHTNSAAETLNRLINMGLPSYNLATTISMIIAQRLIKKLCDNCKIEEKIPQEILISENFPKDLINDNTVVYTHNANGCDKCNSGYKGRIGIFETMFISKEMQEIVLNNGTSLDIKNQARKENILSLRQSGIRKVLKGMTSLSEVNRVTKNA